MKKIAVFFKLPEPMDYPFTKPSYWQGYSEFSEAISQAGGELYIVRGQASYQGNGVFSNSWRIQDGQLKETGPLTADVIFDKGRFKGDGTVPVLNDPEVARFCLDKWEMYQAMSQYCPLTIKVGNSEELLKALPQFDSQKVVFKPVLGAEGNGVFIEKPEYFKEHLPKLEFPALVQEFMDTSVGIPGIMHGTHDLRILVIDGVMQCAYVRTPPEGSLLANVAQGGSLSVVPVTDIPQEVQQLCQTVDERFKHLKHRFYSIDLGYTSEGPKIIEMNSQAAMFPNEMGEDLKRLKQHLAETLVNF